MFKTELDNRIDELEKELGRLEPGSEAYMNVAKDHATLVNSRNSIKKLEHEKFISEEKLALEKSRNIDEQLDREKRTEIEAKSKGTKRMLAEIAAGTWVPVGAYMFWEHTGHIWAGKCLEWVKKRR